MGHSCIKPVGVGEQVENFSSEINFYNVGRCAAETLRKLKACIHVANNPEQACPANWCEGKKTLTPSPELVGHVYEALG